MASAQSEVVPAPANPSTGPRTPEGKARSSMNAVTHGLTARTALIPGEDAAEFRDFAWSVIEDLEPAGPVQNELAARVASLMWKRRRFDEAERQVLEEQAQAYVVRDGGAEGEEEPEKPEVPVDPGDPLKLVRFIVADEFSGKKEKELARLARHEQRVSQQIESTIRLLLKLQNRRDWKARQQGQQGQQERDGQGQLRREGAEPAGSSRESPTSSPTHGRRAAPAGAPAPGAPGAPPPPPAPAQNEVDALNPNVPENPSTPAWTDPPGKN